MPADLAKPADAEPFVKDAQRRPGCAPGSRIHITVHRKSGVLPGSLALNLTQQLRYPLRRDRHFKDTDAKGTVT
jgi:hypothetical protein